MFYPGNISSGRPASDFIPFYGVVTDIVPLEGGCQQRVTILDSNGSITNFIVDPDTYFINHVKLMTGMSVVAFYDASRPAVLIYPPQYQAVVMAQAAPGETVTVGRFGRGLVNREGTLRLNIGPNTEVISENGQPFMGNLENRVLAVVYGPSTRSIPAQTTPYQVVVLCSMGR